MIRFMPASIKSFCQVSILNSPVFFLIIKYKPQEKSLCKYLIKIFTFIPCLLSCHGYAEFKG